MSTFDSKKKKILFDAVCKIDEAEQLLHEAYETLIDNGLEPFDANANYFADITDHMKRLYRENKE